jgi:hypothetical protein
MNRVQRCKDVERYGKIEPRAFFLVIRGSEIDGDSAIRERISAVNDR